MSQIDKDALKAVAKRIASPHIKSKKNTENTTSNLKLYFLLLLALVTLLIILKGNSFNANNNVINNGNIILNSSVEKKDLKHWSDLSREEKNVIKQEATRIFPQVKNIGQGVRWAPISQWLANEKRVIHPNVRDIFRN